MTNTSLTVFAAASAARLSSSFADTHPEPEVSGFYDEATGSVQYVVADPVTRSCAIIDPVLDFDPTSGATRTTSADRLLRHIETHGLTLEWILDTHPHADHLSAAGYLKDVTGAPTAIGERVTEVQKIWKKLYNLPDLFPTDGSQWDHLFADGERFAIGAMEASVLLSPGHTLCSVTYLVGNVAFVHDTLFMPDSGTARTDFPGGSARQLWHSIQEILQLPDGTRLFTGHDYRPNSREAHWESTVAAQKARNQHLKGRDEAEFIKFRMTRDRSLPLPNLMLSALQVNIAGGRLRPPAKPPLSWWRTAMAKRPASAIAGILIVACASVFRVDPIALQIVTSPVLVPALIRTIGSEIVDAVDRLNELLEAADVLLISEKERT